MKVTNIVVGDTKEAENKEYEETKEEIEGKAFDLDDL